MVWVLKVKFGDGGFCVEVKIVKERGPDLGVDGRGLYLLDVGLGKE